MRGWSAGWVACSGTLANAAHSAVTSYRLVLRARAETNAQRRQRNGTRTRNLPDGASCNALWKAGSNSSGDVVL